MNEMYAVVGIGLCIFVFLAFLLGLGSFYGGQWEAVSQGVAKFILLIVGFAIGAFVLIRVLGRR
jgi:hypothetical protein